MSIIFEPMTINKMEVKNRIVRSATYEGTADEPGYPTETLISMTEDLVKGEVGLVVPGFLYVSTDGKAAPRQTSIASDDTVSPLKKLVDRVHAAGGKVCAQIVHAGRQSHPDLIGGLTPIGPSPVTFTPSKITPREMTIEDINRVIDDFGEGARRAKEAGFDAVQLHSAHGYLISAFNSGYSNIRTDQYGGSLENRMRFVLEAYAKVREKVGPDYPVMIKISSADFTENGTTIDESKQIALRLAEEGIDAIEVSGGTMEGTKSPAWTKINSDTDEGYYLSNAATIKKLVGDRTKVIAVGGFRSPGVIEQALETGKADFVAICRPLIREPDLVKKWKEGNMKRTDCISCNLCFAESGKKGGTSCGYLKKEQEQLRDV